VALIHFYQDYPPETVEFVPATWLSSY